MGKGVSEGSRGCGRKGVGAERAILWTLKGTHGVQVVCVGGVRRHWGEGSRAAQ